MTDHTNRGRRWTDKSDVPSIEERARTVAEDSAKKVLTMIGVVEPLRWKGNFQFQDAITRFQNALQERLVREFAEVQLNMGGEFTAEHARAIGLPPNDGTPCDCGGVLRDQGKSLVCDACGQGVFKSNKDDDAQHENLCDRIEGEMEELASTPFPTVDERARTMAEEVMNLRNVDPETELEEIRNYLTKEITEIQRIAGGDFTVDEAIAMGLTDEEHLGPPEEDRSPEELQELQEKVEEFETSTPPEVHPADTPKGEEYSEPAWEPRPFPKLKPHTGEAISEDDGVL